MTQTSFEVMLMTSLSAAWQLLLGVITAHSFMRCRCIRTIPTVRRILIADVIVYEPRPACHKFEVVAVMKNNRQFCLDPESDFTKRLLRDKAE
uniref:Chemokine interleukin-8-like domain-containing protein n=1 Tax=Xiphophorus maculatus TaxID=8083 RepID=A0A3B5R6S3_XIPMA